MCIADAPGSGFLDIKTASNRFSSSLDIICLIFTEHSDTMNSLLIVLVLTVAVSCSYANIRCLPGVCDRVKCEDSLVKQNCEVENGYKFKPKGGFCGCCALCVKVL